MSRFWPPRLFSLLLAGAFLLPAGAPSFATRRVPCSKVISAVNRSVSRAPTRVPDISEIAENLGTSTIWVERCMRMYGRRPERPGRQSAESIEAELRRLERDEPEERAAEDKDAENTPKPERRRRRERPTPTPQGDPLL